MTEQTARWIGAHALESFLVVLVIVLALVFVTWGLIGSACGSFERFAVRLGNILGIRSGSARRFLLPLLIITAGLVPLHFMIEISGEILEGESVVLFDKSLTAGIVSTSNPLALEVFRIITVFGNPLVLGGLTLCVALILAIRRRWIFLTGWLGSIGGGALAGLELKAFFERPRPDTLAPHVPEVYGWAFPSGHAMNAVIVYGLLSYVLMEWIRSTARKIAVLLSAALVLAIGFSRVYLGVHYLSDVLAGYASGLFWLALCISMLEVLEPKPSSSSAA